VITITYILVSINVLIKFNSFKYQPPRGAEAFKFLLGQNGCYSRLVGWLVARSLEGKIVIIIFKFSFAKYGFSICRCWSDVFMLQASQ